MNIITFRRIGSRVTGFVSGKMLNRDFEDVGKAKEVENVLARYKSLSQQGSGEKDLHDAWEEVERHFNPQGAALKRIQKGNKLEITSDGRVYLRGSRIAMPRELADTIIAAADEGEEAIEAYVNFWKLSMLAPEKVRESLFGYVKNFGIVLTDKGYMLLYKAVAAKARPSEASDLARFVAENFVSVAMRGEDPKSYGVYRQEDSYVLVNEAPSTYSLSSVASANRIGWQGSLAGLMRDLQQRRGSFEKIAEHETVYTDLYTKTMDIRLGVQASKDPSECDFNSGPCGHGLHCGAPSYVKNYGLNSRINSGEELIFLLVLVNPKDVVRAFADEDKLGTTRYLPVGIMERDANGDWEAIKQTHFEMEYVDYEVDELNRLYAEVEAELHATSDKSTLDFVQEKIDIISQRIVDLRSEKPEPVEELKRETAPHDSAVEVDYEEEEDDDGSSYEEDDDDDDDDDDYDNSFGCN